MRPFQHPDLQITRRPRPSVPRWGMPDAVLTPEEVAARTQVATEAAFNAATDLGLRVEETRVLHDAFSLVVHLDPSPVVARIPLVLPPGTTPEQQTLRQRRELDVADWLVREGVPATRPSRLVPLEPVIKEYIDRFNARPAVARMRAADAELARAQAG